MFSETGSSNISDAITAILLIQYDVITPSVHHPICIKFGRPVQNHMPMAVKRSKSKPEVEFQDGGRLFSENGSSNLSATD